MTNFFFQLPARMKRWTTPRIALELALPANWGLLSVQEPRPFCGCKCALVCVTLTRIFRTSGSDTLFFPNFWMLKDAIFMVAAVEQWGRKTTLSVSHVCSCLNMRSHVWCFCACIKTSFYLCALCKPQPFLVKPDSSSAIFTWGRL